MIPKKLHFIQIGRVMNEDESFLLERWTTLNPDWEVKVWNEQMIRADLELLPEYEEESSPAARADLVRYSLLRELGGVVPDTDFWPLEPLTPLLEQISDNTSFVGESPAGSLRCSIMGAEPGDGLVNEIWRQIPGVSTMSQNQMHFYRTGAPLLPLAMEARGRRELASCTHVFAPEVFYPYAYSEKASGALPELASYSNTTAVHLWRGSWITGNKGHTFATIMSHLKQQMEGAA